jgi:hypothetical protein
MIPADLLDQLREKDPELWKIATRTELATIEYCDADGDECEPDYIYWSGLRSEAQEAWILYCLMQAIRARVGWGYQITAFGLPIIACVYNRRDYITARGESEAEALGWAYLEAIEAILT